MARNTNPLPTAQQPKKPFVKDTLPMSENLFQEGNGCSRRIHRLSIAIAWMQLVPAVPDPWNTAGSI